MTQSDTIETTFCYHCGDECPTNDYMADDKNFCCHGCQSVYHILSSNNLCSYYHYNEHPGATRVRVNKRFDYLNEPSIVQELVDFTDERITIITFYIPHIHWQIILLKGWIELIHTL